MNCCGSSIKGRDRYHVAAREVQDHCIFCRIIHSPNELGTRIVYQNERLVVFPDINPAAKQHLLVVPRDHIANTSSLAPSDLPLLTEMQQVGETLLRQNSQARPPQLKFGYHAPPWRSVDHLHLHCFELPHQPVWKVSKYSIPTVWITTADLQARLTRLAGLQDGSDGLTEAINKRS